MERTQHTVIFSLLDTPAFGGAEQYMFSHLRFLNNHGYKIVLATNNEKVKQEIMKRLTAKEKETFKVIKAPYRLDAIGNWKGLVKFFLSLPKATVWCFILLKQLKQKYTKVICLWPGFSDRLVFSPIAGFLNCPLVWIEIGPLEPTFKHNFGFPKILYRFAIPYPAKIVTTSLFTKKSIIRNSKFSSEEISLVYPGTRIFSQKEIEQYKKKATAWREKSKLNKKMVIGVIGRLARENEIAIVIKAVSLYLKKNQRDIRLVIIGDGPEKSELESLVTELDLGSNTLFSGFVSEERKYTLLAGCDFFIFPRAWELDGFGMTTIEAMSLGLPVLTTDFGPQIEIVTNGKEGYRYKPHDSEDLCRTIAKMVTLPQSKKNVMRDEAKKRVQKFSDTYSHQKMLEVLKSV